MAQPTVGGALWLENWVLDATVAAVSSQQLNYPASRLLNPYRSDTWASSSATDSWAVFDLGEERLPDCVAIVGANFSGGTAIRFRGSDDAAQSVRPVYWDLPLYPHDNAAQVLRWYLGAPSSSTGAAPRRYWGVRILPATFGAYNNADPFFEMGVVWIGTHVPLAPVPTIQVHAKNPSDRVLSYGRAKWSDPRKPYREADVRLEGLSPGAWYELEARIRAHGERYALLDLHPWSTDPLLKSRGCLYGYFSEDAVDGSGDEPGDLNEMRIKFEEAVA